ncbi:MAG: hypothetical protein HZB76_00390 [Chlamydiae bacterium]|nr:hypothetical protein [Chlamydiota bacterium]
MKKFDLSKPWLKKILSLLKKEIKSELSNNKDLFRLLFGNKPFNSLHNDEIVEAFEKKVLEETNLQDWVVSRWVYHNSDVYEYFYAELSKINPKVEEIKSIAQEKEKTIIEDSIYSFGIEATYLFSILNEVAFAKETFDDLRQKALLALEQEEKEKASSKNVPLEVMVKKQEEELLRIKDKYEKKISSMKKKYFDDMAILKNQISKLQQKIAQK